MTASRARHVLSRMSWGELPFAFSRLARGDDSVRADGITPEEHDAVMAAWKSMPGSASYYSAVCEIAAGRIVATSAPA